MNKKLQEIIDQMFALKNADPILSAALTSTSKTSIFGQIFQLVAFVIFNFQEACKLYMKEIDDKIASQKVPNLPWYRNLGLKFQYGFELDPNSLTGEFLPTFEDNGQVVIATDEQIEASKIIKYVAVTRGISEGRVKISMKIAGENIDEDLSSEKALAFVKYIEETQATGDNIVIVNYLPDVLKLTFKICYNPLVLLENGMSILTGKFPVQDAIREYMKNLPFNGELSVQKLEAIMLQVDGVDDLQNLQVQSKWIEPGVGYGMFQPIEISRIPKSGRFSIKNEETGIEDWSGITYINYQAES